MSETTMNPEIIEEHIDLMNKLLIDTSCKKVKKLKTEQLNTVADEFNIEILKIKPNGKNIKKSKTDLLNDIECKIKSLSNEEIIKIYGEQKMNIRFNDMKIKKIFEKMLKNI